MDGLVYFNSLSDFRDFEDGQIRGDRNEGSSIFSPADGLVINNLTSGIQINLKDHLFDSSVKIDEIFVFCNSGTCSERLRNDFEAIAYVEISDIKSFCKIVSDALPENAALPTLRNRNRIGSWVDYYSINEVAGSRWALPEKIATSKTMDFLHQDEFRLFFYTTDAFDFENVDLFVKSNTVMHIKRSNLQNGFGVKTSALSCILELTKL